MGNRKKKKRKKNEPGFRLGHFLFVRRQRGRTGGEFDIVLDGGIAIIRWCRWMDRGVRGFRRRDRRHLGFLPTSSGIRKSGGNRNNNGNIPAGPNRPSRWRNRIRFRRCLRRNTKPIICPVSPWCQSDVWWQLPTPSALLPAPSASLPSLFQSRVLVSFFCSISSLPSSKNGIEWICSFKLDEIGF